MNSPAVVFHNVGHAYTPGRWVLQNYSATVRRGSIFALLGPNGCGKSTLLRILLGALQPTQGSVSVHGQMALVPQLFQVTFDYTVLDMVLMGRARQVGLFAQPSARDEQAAMASLQRFGLADLAARPFHALSGGQRQLVIFARALVSDAQILLLDEPTSALDLKNQILVLDWIERLSQEDGLTILFTTHHPHHALAVAEEALLMMGDKKYVLGLAKQVLSEGNLQALYGVGIKRLRFAYHEHEYETLVPILSAEQEGKLLTDTAASAQR